MRKLTVLLVVGFLCMAASSASGSIYTAIGDKVSFTDTGDSHTVFYSSSIGSYTGGPYIGKLNDDSTKTWITFCVEADNGAEFITLNTDYTITSINQHTAIATQNDVKDEAKLIYWEYLHGALPSYNVNDVQLAIWSGVQLTTGGVDIRPLTDFIFYNTNHSQTAYSLDTNAQTLYGDAVLALKNNPTQAQAEADSIWVLNPGTNNQSMLFEIPEPASLIVWSLFMAGGSGLGMWVWRRR